MPYQWHTLQLLTLYIYLKSFPFGKLNRNIPWELCGVVPGDACRYVSKATETLHGFWMGDKSSPVGLCSDMKANKPKQSQKQTNKQQQQSKTKQSQNSLQILKDFLFCFVWSSGNIICASASAVSASADEHPGFSAALVPVGWVT